MKVAKPCKSMKMAERYQNELYEKYENVKLVKVPSEFDGKGGGMYVWEVSGEPKAFTAEELEKLERMGLRRVGSEHKRHYRKSNNDTSEKGSGFCQ